MTVRLLIGFALAACAFASRPACADPSSKSNAPTVRSKPPTSEPSQGSGGDPVGYIDGNVYESVVDLRVPCPDIDLVFGRCVGKKIFRNGDISSESQYFYNGAFRIAECAISGGQTSIVTRVFWDTSRETVSCPFAMKSAQNSLFYYAVDITKNICELIAPDGELLQSYDYTPFGLVLASNGNYDNSFLWMSEPFEDLINVCSYLQRNYEPSIGRWLTKDIFGEDGYNQYLYVKNQPISKMDELGFAIAESDCNNALKSVQEGNMSNSQAGVRVARLLNEINSDKKCKKPVIECGCCPYNGQFQGDVRNGSGVITICANNLSSGSDVYGTLVHELTHAYDSCKGTDFNNCEQRACSEIRATKISGVCQPGGAKRRTMLGLWDLSGRRRLYFESEEECIKRNAKASLDSSKCMLDSQGYVDKAYGTCANNMDPLGN